MKAFYLFSIFFLGLLSPLQAKPKPQNVFSDGHGCFILFDLNKNKTVQKFGSLCRTRQPACSTFKVALSLIAFEKGLLLDENTIIKWDSTRYEFPAWNKEHSAKSWMADSVVWVSQRLTSQLGRAAVEKALKEFKYGTADMSGGVQGAWLTEGKGSDFKTTLLISPEEQVEFLSKLWNKSLPLSARSQQMTLTLLPQQPTPGGYELLGKTGSGYLGPSQTKRLGWYVAYLKRDTSAYVAVLDFTSDKKPGNKVLPGQEAKERMKQVLQELGY